MTSSSSLPWTPHEIQFHYDEKLLSSCALSLLRRRHSHHPDPPPQAKVINTNFDDTVIVSPLDEEEEEEVIAIPSDDDEGGDILLQSSREQKHGQYANDDCRVLFEQHAAHYQRPPLTKEEIQYWEDATANSRVEDTSNVKNKGGTPITPRIEAFFTSVLFVHTHNAHYESESEVYHKVALNRFSDKMVHELPLMVSPMDTSTAANVMSNGDAAVGGYKVLPTAAATTTAMNEILVSLHNEEEIYNIGKKLGRLWSSSNNNIEQQQQTTASSIVTSNIFDSWWWLGDDHYHYFSFLFGRGRNDSEQQEDEVLAKSRNKENHHHDKSSTKHDKNKLLLSNENELDGLVDEDGGHTS